MRNLLSVLLLCCCCYGLVTACGRSRRRGRCRRAPPPDRTKPTISCPHNIHAYADPFQVNTKVWWNETSVVANDNRDGAITPTKTGLDPGKIFSEGVTIIKYHARDKSGNYASCYFTITVEVIRCHRWSSVSDGWKICHVSYDMRLGSTCWFGCYSGHKLVGKSKSVCLASRQWSVPTQPYCQKIQCDALIPTSGQYGVVDIVCTEGNYYRSKCLYDCADGYSVLPGYNKVRLCNEYGSWFGNTPTCVDTEAPVYSTCPYVKVGYAERSKTTGRVWWNQPLASDNSGHVTVEQIYGPSSGTELAVGEHNIKYMAYDDVNNTAICEFNVIVKQIKCHTIYPLPYTSVVCPKGRILGSLCEFVCDNGTALNGQANVECAKSDSVIPNGAWTFSNSQPYCENQNTCPALRAPDNGALACDTWLAGKYCQMLCEEGHVVIDDPQTKYINEVDIQKNLLVCGDSGIWYINGDIPNCQEVSERLLQILRIDVDYMYYEGECSESRNDIKEKFLTAFTTSTNISCQPPACSIGNVQIVCGDATSTRKREISPALRLQVSMELSTDLDPIDIVKSRQSIKTSLKYAQENGDLGLVIDGTPINPSEIAVSQPEVTCNTGSAFDKKSIQCVKCNAGYYHDTVNDACSSCARGQYQDEAKQTTCKQCPSGKTTERNGAHSSTQCVDACPAGTYSPTGTPPCSACDLGWYSVEWGTTECTQCPGNQITLNPGASSITKCQEFDITFTVLDDTEELSAATLTLEVGDLNTFAVACWVKCIECDNIVTIIGADGTSILSVINTDQLTIQLFGNLYGAGEDLAGSMLWMQVTVIYTGSEIKVYLNELELLNESVLSPPTMPASLNLTLGGVGFIGSLSQLNMWSDVTAHTPSVTNTCFKASTGDVISWRQVSDVDGSFVITNSYCDAEDNCESSPCQNNGSCTDSIGSYVCTCRRGYTGSTCETNIDDCPGNACYSGSTCVDGDDTYACACPDGFSGELCETKVVDGGWSEWGISGACSVTCDVGVQQRSRICENPIPINGGKECEGSDTEYITCLTNTTCVNECTNDPSDIENGNMNCDWTDNDTRVCNPTCNEGFDFDNDKFVDASGIVCGPDTGYTWSHNNTDNPNGQIPSCTAKVNAVSNKVNFSAEYPSLTAVTPEVFSAIADKMNENVKQIGCVGTGRCQHEETTVYPSEEATDRKRKRRDTIYIMFTIQLSCDISTDMDECYDLLADVIATLESYITQLQFTIQYGGNDYDVGLNSSSLAGTSTCDPGLVPVWQYCISCGKGTYTADDYCKECTYGYYQDEEGQTSCKECPEGWTTAGLMTRDKKYCNIPNPVDKGHMRWQLIGLATAYAVVVVMMFVVTLCICKSIKSNKNRTNALSGYSATHAGMENSNVRFGMHTMKNPKICPALDNPAYMLSDWDTEELTTIPLPRYNAVSPPPGYTSTIPTKTDAWT